MATTPNSIELRGAVAALYRCTDGEGMVEGRAGSGKSVGILTRLHHAALTYPGARILICRKTRESCNESVLVSWEEKVLGPTHPMVLGATRPNRHAYTYPNRSSIVVGGLDNPEKLFSTEWDMVYVNEATEITTDAWELFGRAMRNNRMPFQQRIADCNPGPPSSWLNKRATPAGDDLRDASTPEKYRRLQRFNHGPQSGKMRRLISVHQDNPAYFDLQSWKWTLLGQHYMANLKTMSGHRLQRMLLGRWVAAEGSVFPEFSESRHVVAPFGIPASWPFWVGYDPGYDHPTAILWWTIGPDNCAYVTDEIYQGGLSVGQHVENIRKINAAHPGRTVHRYFGDPQHVMSQTAQSPESIASQFRRAMGVSMGTWPRSTDKEAMVNKVRQMLLADQLKVFRTCPNTITEFQSWRYKRTSRGEIPHGDDQYEDANNDAMDVVCGLAAAGLSHDRRPTRVIEPTPSSVSAAISLPRMSGR